MFQVPGVRDGSYKLRVHMNNNNPKDLQCNGKDVSQILRDVSVLSLSVVQIRFVFGHQDNMSMCFIPPYTPLLYGKTGVYRGLDIFLFLL